MRHEAKHVALLVQDAGDIFLDVGTPNLFRGGITFAGGRAKLPDAPGLGVDVDWDLLAQHQRANGG